MKDPATDACKIRIYVYIHVYIYIYIHDVLTSYIASIGLYIARS